MDDGMDPEMLFLVVDYLRRHDVLTPIVSQLESAIDEHQLLGCGQRWNGTPYVRSYKDLIRKFPLSSSVLRNLPLQNRLDPAVPTTWLSLAPPRVFPADTIFRRIQNRCVHQRLRSCPPSLYGRYRHIKTIYGHHGPVFCVAFDRTGRRVITGSDDNRVKIWRTCDGALEHSLLGHTAPISDLAVSLCNLFVGSASGDGSVRLWYLRDGSLVRVLELGSEVTRVVFHPQYVICTTMDGSTHALLLSDAASRDVLTAPSPTEPPRTCEALSVSVSPCKQLFAVGYNHGHIGFFLVDLLGEGFMSPFSDVDISSAGEIVTVAFATRYSEQSPLRIAAGSHTGRFHILSRNSDGLFDIHHALVDRSPFRSHESANLVVILAWAANDSKLVTTYHSSVHVWCTHTGNMLFSNQVHSLGADILSMSVHPLFTDIVFTVSVDGSAVITSLLDGTEVVKFPANDTYQLIDCCFSPNGDFICATSDLGRLVLFGTGSRRRHAKLPESQFFTFENPSNRPNPSDLPPRVLCDAEFEVFRHQPRHLVQCHVARDLSEAESDVDSDVSEEPRPPPLPPSPPIQFIENIDDIVAVPYADARAARGGEAAARHLSEEEESFSMSSETDNEEEDDADELLSDEDLESFQIAVNMVIDSDQRAPNTRRTRRHDSGSDSDRPLRRWRRSRRPEEAGGDENAEGALHRRGRRRRRQRTQPAANPATQATDAPMAARRHRHRRVERAASQQTAQSDRTLNRGRRRDPAATAAAAEAILSRLRVRRSTTAGAVYEQHSPAVTVAIAPQRRMSTRRQNVLNNQLANPTPTSPSRMRTRSAQQSSATIAARVTRQSASVDVEPAAFPGTPPALRRSSRIPYSDQPLRARRRREDELVQLQPQEPVQRPGSAYNTRTQANLAAAVPLSLPGRTTRRSQQAIADMIVSISPRRTRPRTETTRRARSPSGSSDSDVPLRSARRVRRHVER